MRGSGKGESVIVWPLVYIYKFLKKIYNLVRFCIATWQEADKYERSDLLLWGFIIFIIILGFAIRIYTGEGGGPLSR
jgi:hypothetical protein